METVTVKGRDFKQIHNALCELRTVGSLLSEVVNGNIAGRLARVVRDLEEGLEDAYRQDNSQFDSKMSYYSEFQAENGLAAIWSVYELPVHGFLSDHPWQGAQQIRYHETSAPILGTTWADLYRAADLAIERSGDQHHIFIEGFGAYTKGDNSVLWLTTGS